MPLEQSMKSALRDKVSTANKTNVDDVADEVIVMQRGRVVERGLVNKVFTAPSEPYTRQLLDAARKISAAI